MITVDMTKAKDIVKDKLRKERTPKLSELDISFMRAVESGNTELQSVVASQKQELRDITTHETIVAASDPVELKTAMDDLITQINQM